MYHRFSRQARYDDPSLKASEMKCVFTTITRWPVVRLRRCTMVIQRDGVTPRRPSWVFTERAARKLK